MLRKNYAPARERRQVTSLSGKQSITFATLTCLPFVRINFKPENLFQETVMPKQNLVSMSVDDLLKLKDDVTEALNQKAAHLKKELSRLGAMEARSNGSAR